MKPALNKDRHFCLKKPQNTTPPKMNQYMESALKKKEVPLCLGGGGKDTSLPALRGGGKEA